MSTVLLVNKVHKRRHGVCSTTSVVGTFMETPVIRRLQEESGVDVPIEFQRTWTQFPRCASVDWVLGEETMPVGHLTTALGGSRG